MADIAFMPKRHIFQGRHDIAAHQTREAREVLTQHRVALMRHGGRTLLPCMEEFLGFAHLTPLQMAHFSGKPFNPRRHHSQRGKEGSVTVTRDDLR